VTAQGSPLTLWIRRTNARPAAEDLVSTSSRGVRIDSSNLMSRVLKPAAVAAGVGPWVGFHTFRHTCATALFRRGWNAVQVQRYLGHSDAGFTLRCYVHLLDEDVPQPDFAAAVGNTWATQPTETGRSEVATVAAVAGLCRAETAD
jgi:integrase